MRLLAGAQSALEYFEGLQTSNVLLLARTHALQLDQLRTIVASLTTRVGLIDLKIASISKIPDIHAHLHVLADEENQQRDLRRHANEQRKDFLIQIDGIVKDIYQLALKRAQLREEYRTNEVALERLVVCLRKEIERAKVIITKRMEFRTELGRYGSDTDWASYLHRLKATGSMLGFFRGQEKAAINHLVRPEVAKIFNEADDRALKLHSIDVLLKDTLETSTQIALLYKNVMTRARAAAVDLQGSTGVPYSEYISDFKNYADRCIKRFSNVIGQEQLSPSSAQPTQSADASVSIQPDVIAKNAEEIWHHVVKVAQI